MPRTVREWVAVPRRTRLVAGYWPRPLGIDEVYERLSALTDEKRRSLAALHIAETTYECFRMEEVYRELIDSDESDFDGILSALVNLDIRLQHIASHWRELRPLLKAAIEKTDLRLEESEDHPQRRSATERSKSAKRRK
jgi:hypothetical protein